jgi:hypothetical protein
LSPAGHPFARGVSSVRICPRYAARCNTTFAEQSRLPVIAGRVAQHPHPLIAPISTAFCSHTRFSLLKITTSLRLQRRKRLSPEQTDSLLPAPLRGLPP